MNDLQITKSWKSSQTVNFVSLDVRNKDKPHVACSALGACSSLCSRDAHGINRVVYFMFKF